MPILRHEGRGGERLGEEFPSSSRGARRCSARCSAAPDHRPDMSAPVAAPCPWCGKQLERAPNKVNPYFRHPRAGEDEEPCFGAKMPVVSLDAGTGDLAAWNRRAAPALEIDRPPIHLLKAADAFRSTLMDRVDARAHGMAPLWHGWAIVEAYIAGYQAPKLLINTDKTPNPLEPKETT